MFLYYSCSALAQYEIYDTTAPPPPPPSSNYSEEEQLVSSDSIAGYHWDEEPTYGTIEFAPGLYTDVKLSLLKERLNDIEINFNDWLDDVYAAVNSDEIVGGDEIWNLELMQARINDDIVFLEGSIDAVRGYELTPEMEKTLLRSQELIANVREKDREDFLNMDSDTFNESINGNKTVLEEGTDGESGNKMLIALGIGGFIIILILIVWRVRKVTGERKRRQKQIEDTTKVDLSGLYEELEKED